MGHFDQGTQRAILRLYRSSPSEVLAQGGRAPLAPGDAIAGALGPARPYIPWRFAEEYARALPNSELVELETPATGGGWIGLTRSSALQISSAKTERSRQTHELALTVARNPGIHLVVVADGS